MLLFTWMPLCRQCWLSCNLENYNNFWGSCFSFKSGWDWSGDPKVLDENWQMDEQMIRQKDRQQEHIRLISLGNWTENRSSSGYLDNIQILVTNLKNATFLKPFQIWHPSWFKQQMKEQRNIAEIFFQLPFLVRMLHFYSLDCILNH